MPKEQQPVSPQRESSMANSELLIPDGIKKMYQLGRKQPRSPLELLQRPDGTRQFELRLGMRYVDSFIQRSQLPGTISGSESIYIDPNHVNSAVQSTYNYTGLPTEVGMRLGAEELQQTLFDFFRERSETVRLGNELSSTFKVGRRNAKLYIVCTKFPTGWSDTVMINVSDKLAYMYTGVGALFVTS